MSSARPIQFDLPALFAVTFLAGCALALPQDAWLFLLALGIVIFALLLGSAIALVATFLPLYCLWWCARRFAEGAAVFRSPPR